MTTITTYESFNFRRYSTPWVCLVNDDASLNFSVKVGKYTGIKGSEGDLVIINPVEGQVYAYGQKDHRGNNGGYEYIKIVGGVPVGVPTKELVAALKKPEPTESSEPTEVTLKAFTGMLLGVFKISKLTKTTVTLKTAKGELKFDKASGKQTNADNPKYANRIEVL